MLEPRQVLELANAYARELGCISTQPPAILAMNIAIEARESIEVTISAANGQPPMLITISLDSHGDIRLLSSGEAFLTTPPFDSEDILR